jgi:hypothetical protein
MKNELVFDLDGVGYLIEKTERQRKVSCHLPYWAK